MPDELRQRVKKIVGGYYDLMVIRAYVFRDRSRIIEFAEIAVFEADGKSFYFVTYMTSHHGCDQARIEPSAEKHPDRHIAHQTLPHRDPQRFVQLRDGLLVSQRFVFLGGIRQAHLEQKAQNALQKGGVGELGAVRAEAIT